MGGVEAVRLDTLDMIAEATYAFLRRHGWQLPLGTPRAAVDMDETMAREEPELWRLVGDLDDSDVEYIYGYVRSRSLIRLLHQG